MSLLTHCPNCGAPIDPTRDRCEYCDSAYLFREETKLQITADAITFSHGQTVVAAFSTGIVTVNEARRVLGLPDLCINTNAPGE